jgi:UDP-glucose 4-epimerase
MKAALVIGAAGFLGRNTAVALHAHRYAVSGIGHPFAPGESPRNFGVDDWVAADVTLDSLSAMRGEFDLIVHCAGSGSVGYSITHPKEDFDKTVNTTLAVLEYMRLHNREARLIYPSSAAVYGMKPDRPIQENEPLSPVSPYGYHKKISEELCESYAKKYQLRISIIRFFSLYGNGLKKQLFWDACNTFAGRGGKNIFSGSGQETRDWLHINDAVRLILAISGKPAEFEIVNGGSGKRVTVREVLEFMSAEFGFHQDVFFNNKTRAGDPIFYRADNTRARARGWNPSVDWQQGVRDYVYWFKELNRRI